MRTAIGEAARWLAETPHSERSGKPTVVELRDRFGLSAKEAVDAINEANVIRAGSK